MKSPLISAYLSTKYIAFNGSRDVSIRVGHRSLAVDALLHAKKGE
jgi:hypothetical protein